MNYNTRLNSEEWGNIYNDSRVDVFYKEIQTGAVTCQTKEMNSISNIGNKVLEIGCGSGATSVYLAKNGRAATALDFSKESLNCVQKLAEKCGVEVQTVLADATKELPFSDDEFDIVFQAGLLEHFDFDERVELLKNWKRVSSKMVSMIPNAASIAYRTGKALMERDGSWPYGKELPQYTLHQEFSEAGLANIREYTIGDLHALEFLPKRHYLRKALQRWINENPCDDICGQGYLLVTVADKI